jgi:hypothetical protein
MLLRNPEGKQLLGSLEIGGCSTILAGIVCECSLDSYLQDKVQWMGLVNTEEFHKTCSIYCPVNYSLTYALNLEAVLHT